MPAGLQVFNANGSTRLEITDRLTRFYSSYSLTPWNDLSSKFISVNGLVDDGTWIVVFPSPDYVAIIETGGIRVWSNTVWLNFSSFTTVPITLYKM